MSSDSEWDWGARYEARDPESDLTQGDVAWVQGSAFESTFQRSPALIVLNQSCDLVRRLEYSKEIPILLPKMRTTIVSPVVPAHDFFGKKLAAGTKLHNKQEFERILFWNDSMRFYLPASETVRTDCVALLEEVYSLTLWHDDDGVPDISSYEAIAKLPRCGLRPPWAERVGWMAGSLFARIGTPDPPKDKAGELIGNVSKAITETYKEQNPS